MDVIHTDHHDSNTYQASNPFDEPEAIEASNAYGESSANHKTTSSFASDDNSSTAFASLSPSVEHSPLNAKSAQNLPVTPRAHASLGASKSVPNAFQGLFSPTDSPVDRSALFVDTPQTTREIPGTLHLQNDQNVEHLISRIGAVTLVKQLANDLAQRDAHVTLIQRKAEAREMALRKMLRDCQVSNLDIEKRLKDLDGRTATASRAEADHSSKLDQDHDLSSLGAEANMPDRISTAMDDTIIENDHNRTLRPSKRSSITVDKTASPKGWKDFFKPSSGTTRPSYVTVKSSSSVTKKQNTSDASEPDIFNSTANSPAGSRSASIVAGIEVDHTAQASGEASESEPAPKSVAAWALKLVAGNAQNGKSSKANFKQSDGSFQTREVNSRASKSSQHSKLDHSAAAQGRSPRGSFSTTQGPIGKVKAATTASKTSLVGMKDFSASESHADQPDAGETNLGPVEMDTILPEDTRPPTLTQNGHNPSSAEFLTDSFGFIYDQRRQRMKRQASTGLPLDKYGTHAEPIQGHRLSIASRELDEDDGVSIDSRDDLSRTTSRADIPDSGEPYSRHEPTRRWQDYLKLSKLSLIQTELLAHTPSPAPITDITIADPHESDRHPPHIHMSIRGSEPTLGQAPSLSPTMAVSDNAEFVTPSASSPASPTARSEDEVNPVKALVDHLAAIHETSQKEKMAKWNEFLRKVRVDRGRDISAKFSIENRARGKTAPETQIGDGEVVGVAGLGVRGKVGRAKGNEFRSLVLAGIPVALRAKIWAECSGAVALRVPGYYEELVSSNFVDPMVEQQIQMDISRTLTDNIYFRRGAGVDKLREVLLAYARHNTEIGYCQGMNLITANLLLIMPTAEDAFWVLASMIDNILPGKYYDNSLLTSRADQVVLRQYVTEILPQLSEHLDNLGIELEALTFQWFLSIFTDCLSAEALFRVWDMVLCLSEGATFLFQVALALLKLNEKPLLKCDSPAEVYGYINQGMTDHAISIDNLIRASEGLKKEVRTDEILKRRKEAVELEMEASKQREAIRKGKAKVRDSPPSSIHGSESLSASQELAQGRITAADDVVRKRGGKLVREESREQYDQEARQALGELEVRTPMPIDEEMMWRG